MRRQGNAVSTKKSLRQDLTDAWALAKPYWTSDQRWSARGLYAAIMLLDFGRVYLAVRINYWQAHFWDALAAFDTAAFWRLMWEFGVLILIGIGVEATRTYLYQWLEIRWRGWITETYLGRWLAEKAYHRIGMTGTVDNPDQRIADDMEERKAQDDTHQAIDEGELQPIRTFLSVAD